MNTDHTILKSKKHISSIKEDKISTNYIVHFEKGSYVTKKGQMRIETLTVYEGKKRICFDSCDVDVVVFIT